MNEKIEFSTRLRQAMKDAGYPVSPSVLEQELLSKPSSELALAALKEAQDILTGPESVPSEWGDFTTVVRMLNCRILAEHPKLHEILLRIQATNPFQ